MIPSRYELKPKLWHYLLASAGVCFAAFSLWPSGHDKIQVSAIRKDSVHHYTDKQGREHGKTQVQQADARSLRVTNTFLDSIFLALEIKERQLKALTAVGVTTSGTVEAIHDTVYIEGKATPHFKYSDKWLKLDGLLTTPAIIHYETFDSLITVVHTEKKGWFGKRRTYVDAYSLNPNAHIVGLTGMQVPTPKVGRFGIGPNITYGFNGQRWQPSIGISFHYSLIRW